VFALPATRLTTNPYFTAASLCDDLPDSLCHALARTSRRLDVLRRHELSIDVSVDLAVYRLDSSLAATSPCRFQFSIIIVSIHFYPVM
jgi:hypothetical protein